MRYALLLLCAVINLRAADVLSGQAGISVPALTWTHIGVSPAGYLPADQGYDKVFRIPVIDGICGLTKGYRSIGTEPNRSLSCYSVSENRWKILDSPSTYWNDMLPEAAHPMGGFNPDPTSGVIYGYGMDSGSQGSVSPRLVWWYDSVGQAGRWKQTGNGASTGAKFAISSNLINGTFDSINQILVLWGDGYNTIVHYTPSTNRFTWPTTSGTGPTTGIAEIAYAYSSNEGKAYAFGGTAGGGAGTSLNTMWRYNAATFVWETLSPTADGTYGSPTGRHAAMMAYDSADNVFLVAGGCTDANTGCQTYPTDFTWIFDPAASSGQGQWTRIVTSSPTGPSSGSYERLAYVEEDDIFVYIQQGSDGLNDNADAWGFRYRVGSKVGNSPVTFTAPASGTCGAAGVSCNRNTDSWAQGAGIAGSSTSFLEAHAEIGSPGATGTCSYFKPYAQEFTSSSFSNLGSTCTAMMPDVTVPSVQSLEGADVSIAYVGAVPWAAWHQQNNSNFGLDQIAMKAWSGGSWSVGGLIGRASAGVTAITQGRSALADVNGVATIFHQEQLRDNVPSHIYGYVRQWNGSAFVTLGVAVNVLGDSTHITQLDAVAITSDGTNPIVAWTEYTSTSLGTPNSEVDTAPGVYIAQWSGSAWTHPCSAAANVTTGNSANGISVAYIAGDIYVAFNERTATGTSKLFVRKCSAASWSTVGAALNKDSANGWTWRPQMVTDGTNLYVTWSEQGNTQGSYYGVYPWLSFGARPSVYTAKWNGSAWSAMGSALNNNPAQGSATNPGIALQGSTLAVSWGEVQMGTLRQIYAKQYDGTDWVSLGSAPAGQTAATSLLGGTTLKGKPVIK